MSRSGSTRTRSNGAWMHGPSDAVMSLAPRSPHERDAAASITPATQAPPAGVDGAAHALRAGQGQMAAQSAVSTQRAVPGADGHQGVVVADVPEHHAGAGGWGRSRDRRQRRRARPRPHAGPVDLGAPNTTSSIPGPGGRGQGSVASAASGDPVSPDRGREGRRSPRVASDHAACTRPSRVPVVAQVPAPRRG